jgi:hypothetical protein
MPCTATIYSRFPLYRPTKLLDTTWRTKTNKELDNLIEHKNIIHFNEAQRLRWLGHVERVPEERDVKKMYKWKLIASRQVDGKRLGGWIMYWKAWRQ